MQICDKEERYSCFSPIRTRRPGDIPSNLCSRVNGPTLQCCDVGKYPHIRVSTSLGGFFPAHVLWEQPTYLQFYGPAEMLSASCGTCTREHSISILMSISITSALRGANLLKGSVGGRASSYFQQRRFIKPRDITCATIPSATTRSSPPSRGQTLRDQFKFWDRCSARHKSHPDNEFSSENPGQAQGEEQL